MAVSAIAAWMSQGTIAVMAPGGPRVALLPLAPAALAASLGAGALLGLLARAGSPLTPLWLLAFVLLPWLPFHVPAALLTWSGPVTIILWVAVVWNMARGRLHGTLFVPAPALRAGTLALVIFGLAAWRVAPTVPGGDEPHYLVITQSLLYDGDLKIENNHRRGDYQLYFPDQLRPDYLRRGRDGEIYSIHAPGISAVVAPAFAIAGYPGVVVFLILVSALASALLWHVAWLATRSTQACWFGWAAATSSATVIFHSFTVYPDGLGGVLVLAGVWGLLRAHAERANGSSRVAPWWYHGAALALLPWLHSRFALLAGGLGALTLVRLSGVPNPAAKAAAFLTIPAASALGWVGYFVAIYGTPDPSAPYGSAPLGSPSNIPAGLAGLLFDQRFGLLATAPVLAVGLVGFAVMLWRRPRAGEAGDEPHTPAAPDHRRLAIELLSVLAPYLFTVTNFTMWWGGWSAPARFAAPVVPLLGIAAACAWPALQARATKAVALASLALTASISAALIVPEEGRLAFNTRVEPALLLEWASPLANLPAGVPDWFRQPQAAFAGDVAIWLAALAAGWLALRWLERHPAFRTRVAFATAGVAAFAALAMLSLSIVWMRHGAEPTRATTAQLAYLRRLATEPRAVALLLTPPRPLDSTGLAPAFRLVVNPDDQPTGGAERGDRPLMVLPNVPAGRYRLRPRTRGAGGSLMVGIGHDRFALITQELDTPPEPLLIDIPVSVRALVVRGDDRARRVVRRLDVEPVSIHPPGARPTTAFARGAARYGSASVFFLDDLSYPEPQSFWVAGGHGSSVLVRPDPPVRAVSLVVRNAPVVNTVSVASGAWRQELHLAPGEMRRLSIPLEAGQESVLVRFDVAAGFRPSENDPESRDDRWLGAWVQVE